MSKDDVHEVSDMLEDSISENTSNSEDIDEIDNRKKKQTASEKELSIKSKYFVSNMYVEKIFDTMTCTYKQQMEKLEADINDQQKNLLVV